MARLAFIQNINPTELLLIAIVAVVVFGRRLPVVAGQAMAHVQRARRAFNDLRRETGIDDEIRDARRTFEQASYEAKLDPNTPKIQPPSGNPAVVRESPSVETAPVENDATPPRTTDDSGSATAPAEPRDEPS